MFGKVQGYLVSVTSKGQGKVMMNLVVWLIKSPTLPQMKEALQSVKIREKVRRYINTVARGELSIEEEVCKWEQRRADELQQHSCSSYCSHHKCCDQCP